MNRCPNCGAAGQLTLQPVLVAEPVGGYSLAGAQDKTAATVAARLSCPSCGWTTLDRVEGVQVAGDGTITGGHLVIDQPPIAAADPPVADSASDRQRPRRYWSDAIGRYVTVPDDEDEDEDVPR